MLLFVNHCFVSLLATRQHGKMGFSASGVCFEGTDVGQTAEPIPGDHPVQSVAARGCACMHKGVSSDLLFLHLEKVYFWCHLFLTPFILLLNLPPRLSLSQIAESLPLSWFKGENACLPPLHNFRNHLVQEVHTICKRQPPADPNTR